MSDPDTAYRAEMAKSLLGNDLLAEALSTVRMDALLGLAKVHPRDDVTGMLRLQAIVFVTEAMVDYLKAVITRSGANDGGLTMTNKSGVGRRGEI